MVNLAGPLDAVDKASLFEAFERAATSVGLAMFVVHVDATPSTVVYANQLLAEFVGRPLGELVGRPPWELVTASQRALVRDTIAKRGPGAPPLTMAFEIERPDGTRREIDIGVARITSSGAELAVCYFRDTTDEHAAIAAMRRSEARSRSLIEGAPDGVVILQDGRIVHANPVAVSMLGAPDFTAVRGRLLSDYLPDADAARAAERIGQLFAGATVQSSEYNLRTGLVVEVHSVVYEYDGKPAILSFVRDATERLRMQQQLFRADRLAALGTMAATVAHEINNPLTYLQLSLEGLKREAAAETDPARAAMLREQLANALNGVERVARIVRDLRIHARDVNDDPESPIDVVGVVDRALQMVDHDLRHRAQLVRRNPTQSAIVDGVTARLEQVVINLLVNAIQALDADRPAANRITVAVDTTDHSVTIIVADTGRGLPDPDRAFEPFFTTKPVGEGTGLGLSVCKQLVERMRGRIEVLETSDRGTTFAVTLPRRTEPPPPRAPRLTRPSGERLRVLVIDDEPYVGATLHSVLDAHHHVDVAGGGEQALGMLAAASYDVILCDVMMPRMNGRDVYEQVRARWPGAERSIVFVTGGAFVPALASFLGLVDNLRLRKPFTIDDALAIVLDARRRLP